MASLPSAPERQHRRAGHPRPGNLAQLDLAARSEQPAAVREARAGREGRDPWLRLLSRSPATAIGRDGTLTATALPERRGLSLMLTRRSAGCPSAICHAPSARGWADAAGRLRDASCWASLGYGGGEQPAEGDTSPTDSRGDGPVGAPALRSLPACRPARRCYGGARARDCANLP